MNDSQKGKGSHSRVTDFLTSSTDWILKIQAKRLLAVVCWVRGDFNLKTERVNVHSVRKRSWSLSAVDQWQQQGPSSLSQFSLKVNNCLHTGLHFFTTLSSVLRNGERRKVAIEQDTRMGIWRKEGRQWPIAIFFKYYNNRHKSSRRSVEDSLSFK